jgi:hypothetical protein
MSARRHFSHMTANTSSRIEVRTISFETNITSMSDLSYTLCEYDGACPCACQSVNRIKTVYYYVSSQIIFRMLKKANAFWMILKH